MIKNTEFYRSLLCSVDKGRSCTTSDTGIKVMARLVAVCRDGEEDYKFLARQIPLHIDDTLTMVMEFSDDSKVDRFEMKTTHLEKFLEYHSKMTQQDLSVALTVTSRELYSALSQVVACVGCRRTVERLFSHSVESGNPFLGPLALAPSGAVTVTKDCLTDAKKLYSLFYVHGSKLNDMISAIPKTKKNKRCQLHSLDTQKPKPLSCRFYGGSWLDVWDLMSQECKDEVVIIDSDCLLETVETYLCKYKFCSACKTKVLRAYNILTGDLDSSQEKEYCAALYEGLSCCPHESHIHVCCETDFIVHLLDRAEPEITGAYEHRDKHAKTIDIAQEEVLNCLAIHLYERLHRIWQKLRAEEQTWQILLYLGVDTLRKGFETAVEKMHGISRLEQLVMELSEEERARELKQEKKRQKRRNRRQNKCGLDIYEKEMSLKELQDPLESVAVSCEARANQAVEEEEEVVCTESCINESTSCNFVGSGKNEVSLHSNVSDCGYSSSMEGSDMGSRAGSDIACNEGICNHDEADCSNVSPCAKDKEDGTDSCVECWSHSEVNAQHKNKKKKRRGKGLCHTQEEKCESCLTDGNTTGHELSPHGCQTKENFSSCENTRASTTVPIPQTGHQTNIGLRVSPHEWKISLLELLDVAEVNSDDENFLTRDEIQTFVESHQSFLSSRHAYRQHLKEKFTNYCGTTDQTKHSCGKLPTRAGVN